MKSETNKSILNRYERIVEVSTWSVMVLVIFGVRFLPKDPLNDSNTYYLIGGIIAFILIYYLIIQRFFSKNNRLYLKSIADIIFIGVLIHLLKDYGQFFYALYFLPIAAAALSLELINALLIATIASLFIALEIFLGVQGILPAGASSYQGYWQIGFIVFITIFCRILAVQLKQEQKLKEESLARQKVLEEEAVREKEFLNFTSHQLYTPTSIIRGFASLMKKDTKNLSPQQTDAIQEIYDSSKRMADLVSELLSISRIQAGNFKLEKKQTDIKELLASTIKQMNMTKENKDIDISLEIDDNLGSILIDPEKIRMVIYNLLDNAIKYSKSGPIILSARAKQDKIEIAVSDNGIGVPGGEIDKLFQPFHRGTNILAMDNQGTGLGLYIAKQIIEKHEGRIWVESKEVGSKFIFSLPRNEEK